MKVTVSFTDVHPSSRITRLPGTIEVSLTSLAVQVMEFRPDASFTHGKGAGVGVGWGAAIAGAAAKRAADARATLKAPPRKVAPREGLLRNLQRGCRSSMRRRVMG